MQVINKLEIKYGKVASCLTPNQWFIEDKDNWLIGEVDKKKGIFPGFVVIAYSYEDIEWVLGNADELEAHKVESVVLFADFYENGARAPTGEGTFGGLWYKYAEVLKTMQCVEKLRVAGFNVLMYMYEPMNVIWQDKDWTKQAIDIYLHACRFRFNGVYLDGGYFGSHLNTQRAFKFLFNEGFKIFLHQSVTMIGTDSMSWRDNPYGTMPSVHVLPFCTWTLMNELCYNKEVDGHIYNWWPTVKSEWQRCKDYAGQSLGHMKWYIRSGEGNPPYTVEEFWRLTARHGMAAIIKRRYWDEWKDVFYEAWKESNDG